MMEFVQRDISKKLSSVLQKGKSVLLLGPRQTGKTTLIKQMNSDAYFSLVDVRQRQRYEKNPGLMADEIELIAEQKTKKPLIIIDEVQKIPILMDVAQDLIDRGVAQFILTGSSARKLRRGGEVNLLPGRVISLYMDPLSLDEIPKHVSLEELLLYGSLPEVTLIKDHDSKEELLESYITTYLEEEIRAEALVRDIGLFANFLELASSESCNPLNFSNLSKQIGVKIKTIKGYYEILDDCLIAERIEPFSYVSTRRKLSKSQKYLFFDLGVRRLAAKEGRRLPTTYLGNLFEQFVGLELIRKLRNKKMKVCYWRDLDGPEVDWVVDTQDECIPIEVKYSDSPTLKDARHLLTFLDEYEHAKKGFIICRTPRDMKLAENIYALSWKNIDQLFG